MGLTNRQANLLLEEGADVILTKIAGLEKTSKLYSCINIIDVIAMACLSTSLISLATLAISSDTETAHILAIVNLTLQITLGLVTSWHTVIGPSTKHKVCSEISKDYNTLYREIMIQIANIRNGYDLDTEEEALFERLMYYSSQAQNINDKEPMSLFSTRKKDHVIRTSITHDVELI